MSQKKSYIFLHNNECKTPSIEIYIDLMSINFNLLSVLLHYAYHQISDYWITNNNIIATYFVLSNIINVVLEMIFVYVSKNLS